MFDDDEGPKDWEIKDEEPPEHLQKKWEQEEAPGSQPVICPSCKKDNPATSLTCIFCGSVLSREICPVSCFFPWIKRLFKKH